MATERKREISTTPKKAKAFEQKYISAAELATRWGVSLSSIYHGNCESHRLHPVRFGRAIRFLRREVLELEKEKDPLAA